MSALLVDDHAIVRRGVRQLLAAVGETDVREAADGAEALGACRQARPDLVVLDVNLPGASGLDLLARLLREHPGLKVLVLTMHADPAYAAKALAAGACGFVSKAADPDELTAALVRVLRGGRSVEAAVAQRMACAAHASPGAGLTGRELDIVRLIAAGRTPAEAATDIGVSYKTVANACTAIKAKLGAAHLGDLVRRAMDLGIA